MAKRRELVRTSDERRRGPRDAAAQRRSAEAPPRGRGSTREQRPQRPERSKPHTSPMPRPAEIPARPKNAAQAKARAKARKAKAPKVIRIPLRERLLIRLAAIDLDPRRFVTRVPFVVLVIGALGLGLGVTLWLSTDAAERSYQLGHARQVNQALLQQKEGLERDVLEAQAAPALAEAARNLGMIPSTNTAHLVQDPSGNWMVVGTPKPAAGVQPPPLNSPLPDPVAPAPPAPPAPRVVDPREVTVHLPPRGAVPSSPEIPVPGAVPVAPGTAAVPLGAVPLGAAPLVPAPPATAPLVPAPLLAAPVIAPPAEPVLAPGQLPVPAPAPLDAAAPHLDSPQSLTLPGPPPGADQLLPPAPGAPA